jgi:glycosyltransferase involved in cell wall biosynthesis
MISVIMPSYLGEYKRAAKNRDKKIVRAINSVRGQTFEDWELIIIADGCNKTVEIVQDINYLYNDKRIKLLYIDKQPIWSGTVRNTGLDEAKGDYACYLDIDDAFAPGHLQGIAKFHKKDWYWFDDYIWNGKEFRHRKCHINKVGRCGTSNLMHKPGLARWNAKDNYAHDWKFIGKLRQASGNYEYIKSGEYLVCHTPGRWDI